MSIKIWIGRQPNGYEAEALRKLAVDLENLGVEGHLLANFFIDGHEFDLVFVKSDGVFQIEMKQAEGVITGAINGVWKARNGDETYQLHGGRGENPYQQMLTQYRVLTEWLETHKTEFLSEYAAQKTWFRSKQAQGAPVKIRSLLAIYPALHPSSTFDLDWKVKVVSYEALPLILTESTVRVNLTEEEMVALARTLNLDEWSQPTHLIPRSLTEPPARSIPPSVFGAIRHAWLYVQLVIAELLIAQLIGRRNHLVAALVDGIEIEPQGGNPTIHLERQPSSHEVIPAPILSPKLALLMQTLLI